ncbi:MAG TPA: hypothetical protein VMC85_05360, partial [Desulfomonilaceae bacterium]|nr:hypothetical protein [Desulfomonilaceae bacterium]
MTKVMGAGRDLLFGAGVVQRVKNRHCTHGLERAPSYAPSGWFVFFADPRLAPWAVLLLCFAAASIAYACGRFPREWCHAYGLTGCWQMRRPESKLTSGAKARS